MTTATQSRIFELFLKSGIHDENSECLHALNSIKTAMLPSQDPQFLVQFDSKQVSCYAYVIERFEKFTLQRIRLAESLLFKMRLAKWQK